MIGRRPLLLGIGAVVVIQILIWWWAGSLVWSFRDVVVGVGSPEAAAGARFALAVFAGAGINAIALLAFLFRQRGWGWAVLFAVQWVDLAVTLAWGALISPWWWLISAAAACAIALLFLLRKDNRLISG